MRLKWQIIDLLLALHGKVDLLLMTEQELETLVGKLDATTNTIAGTVADVKAAVKDSADRQQAEIDALKAQIASGTPVTQAQLDSLGAGASAILDKLTAVEAALLPIGADVSNPVPDLPPTV